MRDKKYYLRLDDEWVEDPMWGVEASGTRKKRLAKLAKINRIARIRLFMKGKHV